VTFRRVCPVACGYPYNETSGETSAECVEITTPQYLDPNFKKYVPKYPGTTCAHSANAYTSACYEKHPRPDAVAELAPLRVRLRE